MVTCRHQTLPLACPAPCRPPAQAQAQAHFGGIPRLFAALAHPPCISAACLAFAMLRLRSLPASFFPAPPPPLAAPRSASPPFCPSLGGPDHVVGFTLTPSATRGQREVVVMANSASAAAASPLSGSGAASALRLLFVEMGTGYDQHGQDVTAAAVRACKNAISSNSIPAFRTGALPGVSYQQMKLKVKLGVPHSVQKDLDIEKVKAVFPYGEILEVEVVDGGLICSSGFALEAMGDKNDDCYVVNAAVYVGY